MAADSAVRLFPASSYCRHLLVRYSFCLFIFLSLFFPTPHESRISVFRSTRLSPLGARYSTLLCSSRSNDLTCSGYLSGSTTLFRETSLTETLTGLSRSDKPGFEALRILGRQSRRSFYSFDKSARLLYSGDCCRIRSGGLPGKV